jgi:hypothetical protein
VTTDPTEMDRFIAWCRGDILDGSRDYRALDAVQRFRLYEANMEKAARDALIKINENK